MTEYFGAYEVFHTLSRKAAAGLIGADNLVGDRYSLELEIIDGVHIAWIVNKFDHKVGFLNPSVSRHLSLLAAEGLELCAVLSFVAYSEGSPQNESGFTDLPETPEFQEGLQETDGYYWGEVAVFAFNPAYKEAYTTFISGVSKRIEDNIRPEINLQAEGIKKIIESDGSWSPDKTVPMPKPQKGMALLKCRRSISDKLIEQGRKGNKGCYLVAWVFLLALVALVIFGLKSCGLF